MSDIQIRPATPDDAPAIARVHVQSWRESYTDIVPDSVFAVRTAEQRTTVWHNILTESDERVVVYVAEDPRVGLVGFASGYADQKDVQGYDAEVTSIYLLRSYQGKGIGRALFSAVVQALADNGSRSLLVWALADNPAHPFYAHLGGQLVAEKDVDMGGKLLPEVGYGWADIADAIA